MQRCKPEAQLRNKDGRGISGAESSGQLNQLTDVRVKQIVNSNAIFEGYIVWQAKQTESQRDAMMKNEMPCASTLQPASNPKQGKARFQNNARPN